MESIYFYCLIVLQKASVNAQQSSTLLHVLLYIILCNVFLNQVNRIQKLISKVWFFLQSQVRIGCSKASEEKDSPDSSSKNSCFHNKEYPKSLCRKDTKMVMEKLGLFYSPESEGPKEMIGFNELSKLFDETEPSLEEVKDAFDIFDANQKGFIVAEDLQRVLPNLGLKDGIELVNCRNMIKRFDENGDDRIDFNQFVKLMESSFC
ncbi:hypothetical protein K2173_020072 [Erythroxylum novogranatense]|uniref:EF-hand domain-containing protein n=1 Tax=Erythroxylum novogranatense TaxID=1862640 RepID=A0AAV8UB96_9ROSI|nr:hypothetical protein K2173_020072 [Erythroxylum novogranatense]